MKVVLGCMNFGKRTPEPVARSLVDLAIERGIIDFDTANAYGDGESERILGRALAGRRDRVHVATKVGWWRKEGLAPARMALAIEESRARLKMDHVDLLYLHVPDHATPVAATLDGVSAALAARACLSYGVSNFASWQILELIHAAEAAALPRPVRAQQLYNLLIRQLELEYFRFAKRYGVPTAAYNPLAGGLLTGRHTPDTALTGTRFDRNSLYQKRYMSRAFFAATEAFAAIARSAGLSLLTLAYAWLAQRQEVHEIVVGPATLAHLEEALAALVTPLSAETIAAIDAAHRELVGTDASYAR